MDCLREHHEEHSMNERHRRRLKLREPSSDSVKVFWPQSKDEVLRKVKRVVQHLADLNDVLDIWLFGSYATDQFMHSSDVDLCIVLSEDSELQEVDIMEYAGRLKVGLRFEFHIYRESTFKDLLSDETGFVSREIVSKGIHLHSN
ncbi:MAG: hypothetical protein GF411_18965 [Candidatus Lokiarchaeota archaeon]|nr:hypothetical protein [Candidatus Lokiarchaeota archaeon]